MANQASHALIALAAHTDRPANRGSLAGALGPVLADLAEIVGPDKRGAAAIGTMNHNNLLARQFHSWVVLGDAGIVPACDLAQEDVRKDVAAEAEVGDAGNVEDRHVGAQHGGMWISLTFEEESMSSVMGMSEAPKSTRPLVTCAMPAARADRLIVDLRRPDAPRCTR